VIQTNIYGFGSIVPRIAEVLYSETIKEKELVITIIIYNNIISWLIVKSN